MTFPNVLRVAAVAVIFAMAIRYGLVGSILVPPFVTIVLFLMLSFSYSRFPRVSASIALVPGLVVPAMVLVGYLRGKVELALVVFDWILFGWVVWCAARELLGKKSVRRAA